LQYFRQRANEQLSLVEDLLATLKSGDLEAAKAAYVDARPPYEEIEVFASSFEQEDSDIDARPYSFEKGELSRDFIGFHRIERLVYRDANLEAAIPYAERLKVSVQSLIDKLNDPSRFSAAKNFNDMITLATEVPAKKISSEEETWSGQSLLIFKHNWIGIYSQYQPFASLLDPEIANRVDAAYQACMDSVEPFFNADRVAAVPYRELTTPQRGEIVRTSYQFRNALIEARDALGLS
jgi:iron uptake system component EfeO